MKFELDDYNRNAPDELLIKDLQRVAAQFNKCSVTRQEYDSNGKYHSTTQIRRFGNWFGALKKAGLKETRTSPNVPEEDLYMNLEEVWIKLGRQPRYQEMQKPLSKYCIGTYENRFGGWRNALERFVDYVNNGSGSLYSEADNRPKAGVIAQHKTSRTINWRLRFIVMRRDNFKCKNCGRSPATDPSTILHVDHVKAWSNGGETIIENLQTLCSRCNLGKSNLE